MNQKGLAPIAIILIIAGVLILAGGVYFLQKNKISAPAPIACPTDAKICSDGTAVSRTGPNCEFAPCPAEASCEGGVCPVSTSTAPAASSTLSQVEGWKTYNKYGFSVKYPPTLKILENPAMPESYVSSVSFENPLADQTTAGQKIVFNVTIFKDNNQMQNAFKLLTLDDQGKVMVAGYEAKKLFAPKGRVASFTEATVYTIAAKNTSLIFYGPDFSGVSQADQDKILASFKFVK